MSDFNENIDYIESYFKNQLNDSEKKQFEERCIEDKAFARQVALFITAEEGIRQKLLHEKMQDWPEKESNTERAETVPLRKIPILKWLPYASAACVLIAVAIYFSFRAEAPRQLADTYIANHLTLLSQTMNASGDSLQLAIAAYNNKDYNKALQFFQNIYAAHPENVNAKKNIGLVYLLTKNYDKALQQFDELAGMKGLYRNPGLFLKAVTLLERNTPEDKSLAKQLLEQVIAENLEGSKEAAIWLKNWQ